MSDKWFLCLSPENYREIEEKIEIAGAEVIRALDVLISLTGESKPINLEKDILRAEKLVNLEADTLEAKN
jgi:hypothetical protein